MSLRIKAVVDRFVQELKEALEADIQDRIMKEREMQSYIEEREREVAEREAAWKAELSRREAEIARQEARLKMEKENLEKEKSVLMGTASSQDNQDGALEITEAWDLKVQTSEHTSTAYFNVWFTFVTNHGVCVRGRDLSRTSASKLQGTKLMRGEAFGSFNAFNVRSFGAQADGRTDDSQAFIEAWKEACESTGRVSLVIPRGTYLIGPVKFDGPCENVSSLTVQMEARS
ncbi:hypothetical protein L484_013735 [Morus notabilis]|uniref:Rhamnogalacturonase A/B/Epimerase-like pectate lyase domain-containing protein n=1 Tax=Morus notabilis TaxID=981085 RepID=W9QTY1_9ROSA|nr:hypothetical protein L484_013735 [Morus notabilis]